MRPCPILLSCILLSALSALPACEPITPEEDDVIVDSEEALMPAPGDNPAVTKCVGKCAEIQMKYGVRPRTYSGYLNSSNDAEVEFLAAVAEAKSVMSKVRFADGALRPFLRSELTVNFIVEGGNRPLDDNKTTDINGFGIGIDTIYANRNAVKKWIPSELYQMLSSYDPKHPDADTRFHTRTRESGARSVTFDPPTMRLAVRANDGMFAMFRDAAIKKIGAEAFDALPDEGKFFWTTLFFNAGAGGAGAYYDAQGIDWYLTAWDKKDDSIKYGENAQYNALMRTSTFEYMKATSIKD